MVDTEDMEKNTAQRIADIARDIVRQRGYSAFSYADISERVGIRKASIHYHFASKDELVRHLVAEYRQTLARARERIARSSQSPGQQLLQFADLYRNGLEREQICLCAMLAADFAVLPPAIRDELSGYFSDTETWLAAVLQRGCDTAGWQCSPDAACEARGLIAMLQGTQLLARSADDSAAAFEQTVYPLLRARFPDG